MPDIWKKSKVDIWIKLGGLESSGTERDSYWGSPSLKLSNFICPSSPPPTAPSAGLRPSINEVRVIRMATRWRRRPAVWTLKCSGPRPGTGSVLRKPECSEEVLGVGDTFSGVLGAWCTISGSYVYSILEYRSS